MGRKRCQGGECSWRVSIKWPQGRGDKALIDWIHESCKSWGDCTRWILADTGEGYPSCDTIERARQGGLDVGAGTVRQRFGEVRQGASLQIARAMAANPPLPAMRYDLVATMWVQYVTRFPSKNRGQVLGKLLHKEISVAEFWRMVDGCHHFLEARLTAPEPTGLLRQKTA